MESLVDYKNENGIVTITLNDPARRNGLSPAMVDQLVDAVTRLGDEKGVGCAVLTGTGPAFCAGGNPKAMLEPGLYPDMSTTELRRFYQTGIQRTAVAFYALEVPVVAAVNGPAIGAGCDLICMCDLRIAASNASFASSFIKFGLVPGDGGAWFLPRVIGLANASEMMLTGETIDARKALANGLISAVTTPEGLLDAAYERARKIAANPPHATRLTKRLIRECQHLPLTSALELSAGMQAICHKTPDHREAVTAFLEKRPPKFEE